MVFFAQLWACDTLPDYTADRMTAIGWLICHRLDVGLSH